MPMSPEKRVKRSFRVERYWEPKEDNDSGRTEVSLVYRRLAEPARERLSRSYSPTSGTAACVYKRN